MRERTTQERSIEIVVNDEGDFSFVIRGEGGKAIMCSWAKRYETAQEALQAAIELLPGREKEQWQQTNL